MACSKELPRTVAAALTAVLTVIGVVYVTFFSDTFIGPFQGFLTTLGVIVALAIGLIGAFALQRADIKRQELAMDAGAGKER